MNGKEQLWGLSLLKVNGSKREGLILCPTPNTENPVGGVIAPQELGVWVHVRTCCPAGAAPTS